MLRAPLEANNSSVLQRFWTRPVSCLNVRALLKQRRALVTISASVLTAWLFVLADSFTRDGWQRVRIGRHALAACALYAAFGACAGAFMLLLSSVESRLTRALGRMGTYRHRAARATVYAICAALVSSSTAFWVFSGEKVKHSSLAGWAPYVFIALVAAGAFVLAGAASYGFEASARERRGPPLLIAALLTLVGGALIYCDLHLFVALYSRLHTFIEFVAAALLGVALALLLDVSWAALPRVRFAYAALTLLSLWWLGMVTVRGWTRIWLDEALRHVWLEPAYIGRMLQRMQVAESFLSNPIGYQGLELSRLQRLRERYDITSTEQSPIWTQPYRELPEFQKAISALRGAHKPYNVLVYYVDTLRQDVTADPNIMPSVNAFAKRSLNFRRAYSSGSDTIRALPGLVGGTYSPDEEQPGDLLEVARRAQMESVLVIAQSAREFLGKLRPSFRFDQTVVLSDYAPEKEVWGYGADGPTAGPIVDRTLDWIRKNRDSRFFMWLFNFDVHAWRELDERYVHDAAKRFAVPDAGDLNWRYRVVARALDEEFGRLITGLEQLGVADDTIILFVSDHGEALGREGFWVHSVFLWESLIRVPLMLRVPGLPARTVDARVSLVDVPPTLARYMLTEPKLDVYDGEDLLGYLVPKRPKRRLPLLTQATSQQQLVRIGIIDAEEPWKLVLSFESARPELYDLRSADPDAVSVADQHARPTLRLLSTLVRSPIFPRIGDENASPPSP